MTRTPLAFDRPTYERKLILGLSLLCSLAVSSEAQEAGLRKDSTACQVASSVIAATGYPVLSQLYTDTTGTYTDAATGVTDPIRIQTLGSETSRVEIAATQGTSVRILKGGLGRFRPSGGKAKDLSTVNTFHERVPTNPALSLLAECTSPNVQAVDGGTVTIDGAVLQEIDLAWTAWPSAPNSMVAQDELRLSATRFFINPQQNTVVEMDNDHFAENDSTVPFHCRTVYSGYKAETGHLLPHTIATYRNSRLIETIVVLAYDEPSQIDPQQFNPGGLQ